MSIQSCTKSPLVKPKILARIFPYFSPKELARISTVETLWHKMIFENPSFTSRVFSFLPAFRIVSYPVKASMLMTIGADRHKINMVFNEAIGCWNIELLKGILLHDIGRDVPWHSLEVLFIESFPHHEPYVSEAIANKDLTIPQKALYDEALRNKRWHIFLQILDFVIKHNIPVPKTELQLIYNSAAENFEKNVCIQVANYAKRVGFRLELVIFLEEEEEEDETLALTESKPLLGINETSERTGVDLTDIDIGLT